MQAKRGLLTVEEALAVHNRIANGDAKKTFEQVVCEVKRERNLIYINQVLEEADRKLQERLKNYRDASGKQVQLDPEKRAKLLGALGQKLVSMQDGVMEADGKDFAKIIKENLDPKYWKRYIYGGVEAALELSGLWWKFGDASYYGFGSATKSAAASGVESAASSGAENVGMQNHIWGTVKEYLTQHGIPNPTDRQILEGSKIIAHDNGIGVKIWGIDGTPLDTGMGQGYLLKFGGLVKKLAMIKGM